MIRATRRYGEGWGKRIMSSVKWTNEQLDAITAKDCNLLVAAAAGAGKTAVLVERIIRKITDEKNPIDIDRLLIMTFTNAAASEMREKISQAVSKVLDENPESRLIHRQMALLGKASITTIHSFCKDVIKANFHVIDIDPNFRIADETESTLMKLEALNDLFEAQYEKESNEEFMRLLESYGGNRDDQRLMDMVLELYTFIQSSPWPEEWLNQNTEILKAEGINDFGDTIWGKVLLNNAEIELTGMKDMLERSVEIIKNAKGLENYLPIYQEDLANIMDHLSIIKNEISDNKWNMLCESLSNNEFARLKSASRDADKDKQEEVKAIRNDVKERIKKLKNNTISNNSEELLRDVRELYPQMKCLSELASGLSTLYLEKKKKKSVMDFNDLEHYCVEILTQRTEDGSIKPSDTALAYREKFHEIMVDEYQDSNLVQEIIINMVSRVDENKPNIFMVGDVKQSIYKFRQARPELFMEKYNTYSDQPDALFTKILLFKNFRSRKTVIDAVNYLFRQIMSFNAGELDYTKKEELNPGANYDENMADNAICAGSTEILLMEMKDSGKKDLVDTENIENAGDESNSEIDEEILDKIQSEARMLAQRIITLLNPDEDGKVYSIYDKERKEYRRADYRDIVILLRTTKNWSDVFSEELALSGIPVFADAGEGFFKTVEIEVMLSLLQIIDNPLQDIPLLSVLRSPIFSFTTDELTDIRLINRGNNLFYGIEKQAESGNQKAEQFLHSLARWRDTSRYLPIDQLINMLYDETGYYMTVGAMPAGEQRQANLRILFDRAKQFEETSYKGLFNFITFIDRLKTSKSDMGSAKILSENDNVVRIMSIHKSKGLEFPIVFLSGCGKRFNLQDTNKSILLHQDLGFGPDVVDLEKRLSWSTAAKEALKEKTTTETLSEEMRILYVALTRAREKLIITGSVNDAQKSLKKWSMAAGSKEEKIPDYEVLKGRTFLDWICPAVLRHKNFDGLRTLNETESEFNGALIEDDSVWHVDLWNSNNVRINKEEREIQDYDFINWLDSLSADCGDTNKRENKNDIVDEFNREINDGVNSAVKDERKTKLEAEIDRRLAWEYKYLAASKIPAKVSVTELKRRFSVQSQEEGIFIPGFLTPSIKKPLFLEEKKGLTSSQKGTIIHFVMQSLDFSVLRTITGHSDIGTQNKLDYSSVIEKHINNMVSKDLLSKTQADSVDISMINGLLNSQLGIRMLKADKLNREIPFNMQIPVEEIIKDKKEDNLQGETVLLQGVIDCYFEENSELILVDYKTDNVPEGKEDTILKRYKLQMDYYKRALENITGKKVKERFIYLFRSSKTLEIT